MFDDIRETEEIKEEGPAILGLILVGAVFKQMELEKCFKIYLVDKKRGKTILLRNLERTAHQYGLTAKELLDYVDDFAMDFACVADGN